MVTVHHHHLGVAVRTYRVIGESNFVAFASRIYDKICNTRKPLTRSNWIQNMPTFSKYCPQKIVYHCSGWKENCTCIYRRPFRDDRLHLEIWFRRNTRKWTRFSAPTPSKIYPSRRRPMVREVNAYLETKKKNQINLLEMIDEQPVSNRDLTIRTSTFEDIFLTPLRTILLIFFIHTAI